MADVLLEWRWLGFNLFDPACLTDTPVTVLRIYVTAIDPSRLPLPSGWADGSTVLLATVLAEWYSRCIGPSCYDTTLYTMIMLSLQNRKCYQNNKLSNYVYSYLEKYTPLHIYQVSYHCSCKLPHHLTLIGFDYVIFTFYFHDTIWTVINIVL